MGFIFSSINVLVFTASKAAVLIMFQGLSNVWLEEEVRIG